MERLQAALEPGRFRQHHIPPRPFGDDLDPRYSPLQQVGSGWGPGTPCLRGAGNLMLGCAGLGRRTPSWPSCLAFLSNSCFARRSTFFLILFFHFMLSLIHPKFTEHLLYIRACALLVGHRFANTEYCLKNAVDAGCENNALRVGVFAGWHDCWNR